MPLPVPLLDDLTWSELVEEARDRIPSNSPQWTDHNVHDPGITIFELMAAACEQVSYRIDQVPVSHRAAFLSLVGVKQRRAARAAVVLEAQPSGVLEVARGWELEAEGDGATVQFVVASSRRVSPTRVIELQVEVASGLVTAIPPLTGEPFEPLGSDGRAVLTMVLSQAAPSGRFSLWIESAYDAEIARGTATLPAHRPVELGWESRGDTGWRPLPVGAIDDHTSGLRRSGLISLELGSEGIVALRCRVVHGRYDRAPVVVAVCSNPLLARAKVTGVEGNPPAYARWRVVEPAQSDPLELVTRVGVREGRDAESVDEALGRAAIRLFAHERLIDLAAAHGAESLEQVPRMELLQSAVPARAVTLLDVERIAFATPGAQLARVRAFADTDLGVRCAEAPGAVSVTIVPFLPPGRPEPTPELIACVARRLARAKTLGTRIRVFGPAYTTVDVSASVVATPGADRAKTRTLVERAIRTFLDPLIGGPAGLGWPFGRDVYRTEVMTVVGTVPGVELVAEVRVATGSADACSNACVPDGGLVAVGSLCVEVS